MDRLPGFRDFFPEPLPNQDAWSADARGYIFDAWRAVAKRYGFREYDGPPLESLALFTAKSGDEIVRQLYNFNDKGGDEIALRPEMTPTFARMVAASERQYKKPIKWFSIPQLFRYERQQKGRKREHFQLNVDIVGEAGPTADAELIAVLIDVLREFRLTSEDFEIRLSSRDAWENFYGERGDSERAYEFYQIIDKLEREDPAKSDEKLKGLGFTLAEVREFIDRAEPTEDLRVILDDLAARVAADEGFNPGLARALGLRDPCRRAHERALPRPQPRRLAAAPARAGARARARGGRGGAGRAGGPRGGAGRRRDRRQRGLHCGRRPWC